MWGIREEWRKMCEGLGVTCEGTDGSRGEQVGIASHWSFNVSNFLIDHIPSLSLNILSEDIPNINITETLLMLFC